MQEITIRWIPVGEALPSWDGQHENHSSRVVLVYLKYHAGHPAEFPFIEPGFYDNDHRTWCRNDGIGTTLSDVIAWADMPFPEIRAYDFYRKDYRYE